MYDTRKRDFEIGHSLKWFWFRNGQHLMGIGAGFNHRDRFSCRFLDERTRGGHWVDLYWWSVDILLYQVCEDKGHEATEKQGGAVRLYVRAK
jgi:hypothetical protein